MSRNSYFWLCVAISIIGVFALGFFSVNHAFRKYQQGSLLEGVPVDFFKEGVKEFREETASTTYLLREVLRQNVVSESPNATIAKPAL